MAGAIALVWELIANDNASAAFARVGTAAEVNAAKTTSMAGALTKVGEVAALAGAVVAAASLKMAADYQQNLTKLVTTAGETQANIKMVGQGMLDMAGQVGIGANDLSKAMYIIESSGIHGADALTVLKASAEGAKQENADLGHVVDATSTILHDYNLPASEAANVTSQLITAISHGKTNFDDFTGALHSVTPNASAAGISLADVTGILSSMTDSGMSADQAAQNLSTTITRFTGGRMTGPMIKELGALGISAQDLANNLGSGPGKTSLAATLQTVSDAILHNMGPAGTVLLKTMNQSTQAGHDAATMFAALPPAAQKLAKAYEEGNVSQTAWRKESRALVGEQGVLAASWKTNYDNANGFNQVLKSGGIDVQSYQAALAKATGGQEALSVVLQTTGAHAAATNDAIKDIAGSTAQADGNIKGWDEVQGNFNQKLSETVAQIKSWFIELGQHLLPAATSFLSWLQSSFTWMSKHADLMRAIGEATAAVAAALITYVAITKTAAAATALLTVAADANPFVLLTSVIAGLGVALVGLDHNSTDAAKSLNGVEAPQSLLSKATDLTTQGFHNLGSLFSGSFMEGTTSISDRLHNLGGIFSTLKTQGIDPAIEATARIKASQDAQKTSVDNLNKSIQDNIDKLSADNKGVLTQSAANDGLTRAYNAMSQSVKDNGSAIDGNSTSALANRDKLRELITAINTKLAADYTATASTGQLAKATDDFTATANANRTMIADMATKLHLSRDQVDLLTGAIKQVPDAHETRITTPGAPEANQAMTDLRSLIVNMPKETSISLRVLTDIGSGNSQTIQHPTSLSGILDSTIGPGHASGTDRIGPGFVTNGPKAIVGEGNPAHPEFVIPTDPKYRSRALGFMKSLAGHLGMPMMADGGTISSGLSVGMDANMSSFASGFASFQKTLLTRMVKLGQSALGGAIPTGDHLSIIDAALAADGIPSGSWPQWEAGLNTLITRESGWNPRAINLTDSNAAAGHPSMGLMQTIIGTYSTNRNPNTVYDPYDPVSNVAAGINYINNTYGGIGNVQQANANMPALGYDRGGLLMPGFSTVYNGHKVPEVITPPGAGQDSGSGDVVGAIQALGDRFGQELDRQARTIQTMQRQMATR